MITTESVSCCRSHSLVIEVRLSRRRRPLCKWLPLGISKERVQPGGKSLKREQCNECNSCIVPVIGVQPWVYNDSLQQFSQKLNIIPDAKMK